MAAAGQKSAAAAATAAMLLKEQLAAAAAASSASSVSHAHLLKEHQALLNTYAMDTMDSMLKSEEEKGETLTPANNPTGETPIDLTVRLERKS